LALALERHLIKAGEPDVEAVCLHLLATPVIQQADHANLLLDVETFLNNFLFHIACREAGVRTALHSQCSTVSCIWKRSPLRGPVFLHTRHALIRLVDLSNRQLKAHSFCCLPAPLTLAAQAIAGTAPAADPVLVRLTGRCLPNAPDGFRICNNELWRMFDLDHGIRRVAVDESLVSECLAQHLTDDASPVHRLVFDACVRDCFLQVKRELVRSPDNFAVHHATPDFLWWRSGKRLEKVMIVGRGPSARALVAPHCQLLPVALEPHAIATALRAGHVYADRILAYLVRCLLPGVVAVGGTSQQDYLALYRRMLLEAHRRCPFLEHADVHSIDDRTLSRLGGMPLVELDEGTEELLSWLGPTTPMGELEACFLDRPLYETVGSLRCADYLEPALRRWETSQ
jgi:hypothetical protein